VKSFRIGFRYQTFFLPRVLFRGKFPLRRTDPVEAGFEIGFGYVSFFFSFSVSLRGLEAGGDQALLSFVIRVGLQTVRPIITDRTRLAFYLSPTAETKWVPKACCCKMNKPF